MRNGNPRRNVIFFRGIGSYRTYEEWKLVWQAQGPTLNAGSYRTYEEWKPPPILLL